MLRLEAATWRYPSASTPALGPVSLTVKPSEFVLLTGPTGCGKSTLLRLAAGLLGRHGQGRAEGSVRVGGEDPAALSPAARVRRLGFVSQEPADQIVTGTLADEIAFALESIATPAEVIEAAVTEYLAALDLPPEPDRSPREGTARGWWWRARSRRARACCCSTSPWPSSIPRALRACWRGCGRGRTAAWRC